MAFKRKTWKDRLVEFAGRRTLKRISGSADSQMVVDVTRNEGTVSQAGDAFSAANMNDLEQRIADEFSSINNNLKGFTPIVDDTGKITGYKTQAGADTVFPFNNNKSISVRATGGVVWNTSNDTWTCKVTIQLKHEDEILLSLTSNGNTFGPNNWGGGGMSAIIDKSLEI